MMQVNPLVMVGVVLLFFGWLAIPLAVTVLGAALGVMGGILAVDFVSVNFPEIQIPEWSYPAAAIILGGLGWLVAKRLFSLLIFITGVVGALALKAQLDTSMNLSQQLVETPLGQFALTPWFTLFFGVTGGALLSLLKRYLLIVVSSLAGAVLIARNAGMEEKMLILALLGLGFQTLCCTIRPGRLIPGGSDG